MSSPQAPPGGADLDAALTETLADGSLRAVALLEITPAGLRVVRGALSPAPEAREAWRLLRQLAGALSLESSRALPRPLPAVAAALSVDDVTRVATAWGVAEEAARLALDVAGVRAALVAPVHGLGSTELLIALTSRPADPVALGAMDAAAARIAEALARASGGEPAVGGLAQLFAYVAARAPVERLRLWRVEPAAGAATLLAEHPAASGAAPFAPGEVLPLAGSAHARALADGAMLVENARGADPKGSEPTWTHQLLAAEGFRSALHLALPEGGVLELAARADRGLGELLGELRDPLVARAGGLLHALSHTPGPLAAWGPPLGTDGVPTPFQVAFATWLRGLGVPWRRALVLATLEGGDGREVCAAVGDGAPPLIPGEVLEPEPEGGRPSPGSPLARDLTAAPLSLVDELLAAEGQRSALHVALPSVRGAAPTPQATVVLATREPSAYAPEQAAAVDAAAQGLSASLLSFRRWQRAEARARQAGLLLALARAVLGRALPEAWPEAAPLLAKALKAGALLLWPDDGEEPLRWPEGLGPPRPEPDAAGAEACRRGAVVATDLRLSARFEVDPVLVAFGARSAAHVPLPGGGGCLAAASRDAYHFTRDHLQLLEGAAAVLSEAAERRRLARRAAAVQEAALAEQEASLLTLAVRAADGQVVEAGPGAAAALVLDQRQLLSQSLFALVPPAAVLSLRRALEPSAPGGTTDLGDVPLRTGEGYFRRYRFTARPAGQEGLLRLEGRPLTPWERRSALVAALTRVTDAAEVCHGDADPRAAVARAAAAEGLEFAAVHRTSGRWERLDDGPLAVPDGVWDTTPPGVSSRYVADLRPGLPAFLAFLGDPAHDGLALIASPDLTADDAEVTAPFFRRLGAVLEARERESRLVQRRVELDRLVAERTGELRTLHRLGQELAAGTSEPALLRSTVAALAEALPLSGAAALLCRDGVHTSVAAAADDGARRDILAGAETALKEMDPGGHSACVPGEAGVLELAPRKEAAPTGAGAALDAPLTAGGRPVGVLAALPSYPPQADHARLLHTMAHQLSAALERLAARRRDEESRLRAVTDSVADGIIRVDHAGVLRPMNVAARGLLSLLGIPAEGGASEATPLGPLLAETAVQGRPVVRELPLEGPPRRYLAATASPLADPTEGLVVILRDVTEERLLQGRLLQSEKMASVGQLVSGVAHELNNPLTGIIGFAQLLLSRPLDPETERQVRTIYDEAERAAKIVQNLLSFARRRRPAKERVDLNALVQRVVDLRRYELAVNNIEVALELDSASPWTLADPDQLQQVFFNLLNNAMQAILSTERRAGRIVVASGRRDGAVFAAITDDGPGIAPEHLRRVFDPFFTTKGPGEGTGLGLSISYGIVQEHGGHIAVESAPGRGATFTVELPASDDAPPEPGITAERSTRAPAARRRILVIDDEESIRTLLQGLLTLDGHEAEAAATAAEGLQRLRNASYDLVIVDLKMPGVDGRQLYERVRTTDPVLAQRIVFITGDTVSTETRNFLEGLPNPCLEKPFRLSEVRELLARLLT